MRLIATVLLLVTTISCHAQGTTEPDPAIVSVSGQGIATAVPDMVTVSVGVVTQAQTAAAALTANNNAMSALNEVLDGFDIAERDRRTSNFNISPRYDRRSNDGRAPEISSYEVNNQLSIRFREIDSLGELLDAVVKSGSNRIGGMNFGNTNEDELRDEARKAAVGGGRWARSRQGRIDHRSRCPAAASQPARHDDDGRISGRTNLNWRKRDSGDRASHICAAIA
jgi:uncharacterized protein YggE